MATNVLVIAEDYRYDQYILKPLVKAMLAHLNKPHAKVEMCRDPMLMGLAQVLNPENLRYVVEINPLADLYLLIIDRDADPNRSTRITRVLHELRDALRTQQHMLGENAHQEVEVWLLAGHQLPNDWRWNDVCAEQHSKEMYYEPFARSLDVFSQLGGGRKQLGEDAARRYDRVRQLCAEVAELEGRIAVWLAAQ